MPFKESVGPPILAINQGNTFMVTDIDGQIGEHAEGGLFANDTRFLSYYKIYSNDKEWQRLSSSQLTYSSVRICLVNQALLTEKGEIPAETLALTITRAIGRGVREELEVTNFSNQRVRFNLEIALRSDFADLFEVRWHRFYRRGRIETTWHDEENRLHMYYRNDNFQREMIYSIPATDTPTHFANGRIVFELQLESHQTWRSANRFELLSGGAARLTGEQESDEFARLQELWLSDSARLTCSNEEIYRLYKQSLDDVGALRFYDDKYGLDMWIPAAGVPWYVTIFGRDSLIVGLQSMFVNSKLALGALKALGALQAVVHDDWRDAEPGKIAHEMRYGELAHFNKIPHTPYYGTADSTPLYLIALHETWKWRGNTQWLRDYRDTALKCLDWIDQYGDIDQDGFQEYQTRSSEGYENMCWKDSPDSIMYPDGRMVKQPKAVCELQGYVFDAWMRAAEMFEALDDRALATDLRTRARNLQQRFEDAFWSEELGFYALALDASKSPVWTPASNAGHLLWSGICRPDRAARVVERFFQEDFWSGWGIRTLPASHLSYNPYSYHNGSVWPHDNALIAAGCKRYGHADKAAMIARDISRAAEFFFSNRLPELYAGVQRTTHSFPVQHSHANVPQAWAAGSAFQLLATITGLRADAPAGMVFVDPVLPHWLPDLVLEHISVADARLTLRFWKEAQQTMWDATIVGDSKLKVEQRRWSPW